MNTVALRETINYRVIPLRLPYFWQRHLGNIPKDSQWTMMIYGPSFGGKSSLALKLACLLGMYGKVLYDNAEENLGGGTLQEKMRRMRLTSANVFFLDNSSKEGLLEALQSGNYKYCIIDSISKLARSLRELIEMFNDLPDQYKDISFIFILHSDKSLRTYIGPSTLVHDVGIAIEVVDGKAHTEKNRYLSNISNLDFNIF